MNINKLSLWQCCKKTIATTMAITMVATSFSWLGGVEVQADELSVDPKVMTVDFANERREMHPKTGVMLVPNEHLTDGRIIPLNISRLRDDFDNQNILNHTPNNQPTVFEHESSRLARVRTAAERLNGLGIQYDPIFCYTPSWLYQGDQPGWKESEGGKHRTPKDIALYKQWVKDNLQFVKDNNLDIMKYGVWNEYWGLDKSVYDDMAIVAWEAMKEVLPDALMGGPSNGVGDAKDFLSFTRRNGLTLDSVSYHKLDASSLDSIGRDTKEMKSLIQNNDIGVKEVYVEEYQSAQEAFNRGNLVNYFAEMEDTGADEALKSHWHGVGYEGFGDMVWVWNQVPGQNGQQPNKNSSIRRDVWWTMKAYAEMSGMNVDVTQPEDAHAIRVRGLASKDVAAGEAKVLVGSDYFDGPYSEGGKMQAVDRAVDLTIKLDNQPFAGEDVRVDVYEVVQDPTPSSGSEQQHSGGKAPDYNRYLSDDTLQNVDDGLQLVASTSYPSSSANLEVNIPEFKRHDVYMYVIKKDASAPGSFCLKGPDDDVAVEQNPTFTWQKASGATAYDLEIATDKQFENVVHAKQDISGESYTLDTNLTIGERYYWRVTAKNAYGSTPAAQGMYYNFIMSESDEVPGRFTMYLVADYSTGVSVTPKFTWAHAYGVEKFKVQVSKTEDFASLVLNEEVGIGTAQQENIGNMGGNHYFYKVPESLKLDNDTDYFSRIVAVNTHGERVMSGKPHGFKTRPAGDAPGAFNLKAVENPESFSLRGSFHWEESNAAFFYTLEIAEDAAFDNIVTTRTHITTNGYTLAQDELEAGTTYYWRVTAHSAKQRQVLNATAYFINDPDPVNITSAENNGAEFTTEQGPSAPLTKAVQVGIGSGTVSVSFNSVENAESYTIYYGTEPGAYSKSTRRAKGETGAKGEHLTKVISGLEDGTTYYFSATATDSEGNESSHHNEVKAVPIVSEAKQRSLALNKKAMASSIESNNAQRKAELAFDDDGGSRWASASNDDEWIYVDLGTKADITGVYLAWETAYGKEYKIQVSDDAKVWTDVYTQADGKGGSENIKFDTPVSGRYVQMKGIKRGSTFGYSLYSFEVYGSYENLAKGATVTSSSQATADNAIDGKDDTAWTTTSDDEWIYVDLGASYELGGAKLTWGDSYGEEYEIQGSRNPDSGWTTLHKEEYGEGEVDEIYFNQTMSGRYMRFKGIKGSTSGYDLKDFQVFGFEIPKVNVALNKPVTSSSNSADDRQVASAAVDGDTATRWASESRDAQWIYVDLEETYDLTGMMISWEASFGKRYKIQVAQDGADLNEASSWVDAYTEYVDNDNPGGVNDIPLNVSARYVRMQGLQRSNQFGFSIWELEIYGEEAIAVEKYTITYDTNGGNPLEETTKEVAKEETYGTLPVPVRDGYVFEGWYTQAEGGEEVTSSMEVTSSHTIYAQWIEELQTAPKLELLQVLYDACAEIAKAEGYTEESMQALQEALQEAQDTIENQSTDSVKVAKAISDLLSVIVSMEKEEVEEVDTAGLQASLDSIAKMENKNYTAESWAALQAAKEAATQVLTKQDVTGEEISVTVAKLTIAVAGLREKTEEKPQQADKSALQIIYRFMLNTQKGNYTDASWNAFQSVLSSAKVVLDRAGATEKEINDSVQALTTAMSALVEKPADQSADKPAANPIKKGDKFTAKNLKYKVTSVSGKTVSVTGASSKTLTSITIPATVKYKDVTFKVTVVADKAFKGYTKLKKVTIGKNVTKIGKQAFSGDKKLTKISIKGTKLKTVGSKAFQKTGKKLTITVPKSKKAAYKKIMNKKGQSSKTVIK